MSTCHDRSAEYTDLLLQIDVCLHAPPAAAFDNIEIRQRPLDLECLGLLAGGPGWP